MWSCGPGISSPAPDKPATVPTLFELVREGKARNVHTEVVEAIGEESAREYRLKP